MINFDSQEIPAEYLSAVVKTARDVGTDLTQFLRLNHLTQKELENPDVKIRGNLFKKAIALTHKRYTGAKPLSLLLAERFSLTSHGLLGLTLICAPDLRAALMLVEEYGFLLIPSIAIEIHERREISALRFVPKVELGDMAETLIEMVMGAFYSGKLMLETSAPLKISLTHMPAAALLFYEEFWGCKVLVNQKYNQIFFQSQLLARPLHTSNPENFNRLCKQLDEQFAQATANLQFTLKVRQILNVTSD